MVSITVDEDIDMDVAGYVIEMVSKAQCTGQKILPVIINSNGGDVYALQSMRECLRASGLEIVTVVTGFAASAAVGLFACGDRRYIAPSGRLMVHHASMTNYSSMSVRELEIEGHELKLLSAMMFASMGRHCVGDDQYYSNLVKANGDHDLYLSGQEALKHKLATHIGTPTFTTSIKVKTKIVEADKERVKEELQLVRQVTKGALGITKGQKRVVDSDDEGGTVPKQGEKGEKKKRKKRKCDKE